MHDQTLNILKPGFYCNFKIYHLADEDSTTWNANTSCTNNLQEPFQVTWKQKHCWSVQVSLKTIHFGNFAEFKALDKYIGTCLLKQQWDIWFGF